MRWDTTLGSGTAEYAIALRDYDVEGTVESWWRGDDTDYHHIYQDRAIDVTVLHGVDTLVNRTLQKGDFESIAGASLLEVATLCCVRFEAFDHETETLHLTSGVYAPDTDAGYSINVELDRQGTRMEARPYLSYE